MTIYIIKVAKKAVSMVKNLIRRILYFLRLKRVFPTKYVYIEDVERVNNREKLIEKSGSTMLLLLLLNFYYVKNR